MENKKLTAKASVNIDAPASKVWEALTNPKMVKQYLYGTDVHTDWKEGSPITYTGEWEGKPYEDKGKILKVVPEKLLSTTYWSGMSGKEDKPENYNQVDYHLKEENGATKLELTQDNIDTEQSKEHSEKNWNMVLKGMKDLLEK